MAKDRLFQFLKYLLFLPVLTPLIFSSWFYFPFITGKVLFFRLVVELALLISVFYFWKIKTVRYPVSLVWWLYLIFVVVYFLAAVFGVSFLNSFWSNIERADGFLFLIHLFVFFVLASYFFKEERDWKNVFRLSLIACFITIVYGYLQFFHLFGAVSTSGLRISSTLGNAAYYGTYLLINSFLALYLLLSERNIYWRIFYIFSSVICFVTVFLTQTRGAILGLAAGLIIASILTLIRKAKKTYKIGATLIIFGIICGSALIFLSKDYLKTRSDDNVFKKISSISAGDYTTKTRLAAWRSAFEGFKDRPLLGWGPENYNYAFSKHFPAEIYRETSSQLWFDRAHNFFFEYLVTCGILGLLAYLLLLASVFYLININKKLTALEKNVLAGLLAGYLVANFFVFDSSNTYILFALILAFVNRHHADDRQTEKKITWSSLTAGASVLIIIFFLYLGFRSNYEATKSNRLLWKAQYYASQGQPALAYQTYLQASQGNHNLTRFEIRRIFALYALDVAPQFPNYEQAQMIDVAIGEIQKNITEDPYDVRHYYNLSQLYLRSHSFDSSRLDKVIELSAKIIEFGPNRAHAYYQLGEAYFRKNDYQNALTNFQKATEINPNLPDPFVNVYVTAIMMGNTDLENKTAEQIKALVPDFFEQDKNVVRLIPVFKRVGRSDRVISDLEKLVSKSSKNPEYVFNLALAYAEIGDNSRAEAMVKTLSGSGSEVDAQISDFLDKLNKGELLKKK